MSLKGMCQAHTQRLGCHHLLGVKQWQGKGSGSALPSVPGGLCLQGTLSKGTGSGCSLVLFLPCQASGPQPGSSL